MGGIKFDFDYPSNRVRLVAIALRNLFTASALGLFAALFSVSLDL